MSFRDSHQQQHKIDGMRKAASSPHTPAHLRPHIQRKLKEHESMANTSTEQGRHGKGAPLSNVRLPQKKGQAATAGQSPKTAAYYEMNPARAAELLSTSNTSADAEKQIAAPPAPFKTKNSAGAAVAGTPTANHTGPDYKPTAGLSGKNDGGPVEGQAGAVAAGPSGVPRAHAKSGGMNQARISKPSDAIQPKGRRATKSLFFGE